MAAFFPQLQSGAYTQYPVRKLVSYRTILDEQDANTALRAADTGARRDMWMLTLRGLNDTEVGAVQDLFQAVNGPHKSFVFFDPEANILRHSEDLTEPAWAKSAGLALSASPTTPPGAGLGWKLTASASGTEEIWQAAEVPTEFHWSFSFFARSPAGTVANCFARSAHGEIMRAVNLGSEWQRYSLSGRWWPTGLGVEFGLRISAGQEIEVSAMQVDPQPAPAVYRRSASRSGLIENARFAQDRLRVTTLAPNHHQTSIRIVAGFPEDMQ